MSKNRSIRVSNINEFDDWLYNHPDVTQQDRLLIMEFVEDYIKELSDV